MHVPFGMLVVDSFRPNVIVELGTNKGVSYDAFCHAVRQTGLEARCFAIDTWQGDIHTGPYGSEVLTALRAHHDPLYASFSRLVPSTFDDAVQNFPDRYIDLLHIDGTHTFEAVRHDFHTWLPKLSDRAVVLLHDTNVREGDFGVWKLWQELSSQFPNFEFFHGHGLGILRVGNTPTPSFDPIFWLPLKEANTLRDLFFALGSGLVYSFMMNGPSATRDAAESVPGPEPEAVTPQETTNARHTLDGASGTPQPGLWRAIGRSLLPPETRLGRHARRAFGKIRALVVHQ